MDTWSIGKNKANTNPIQTQYKPNQSQYEPKTNPKQTQFSKRQKTMQTLLPQRIMEITRFEVPAKQTQTNPISQQFGGGKSMINEGKVLIYSSFIKVGDTGLEPVTSCV